MVLSSTKKVLSAVAAAAMLACPWAATAAPTLIGDTVTVTFSGGINDSASAMALAGPAEFTSTNLSQAMQVGESINIEATSILFSFNTGYFAPQTITIGDLDFLGDAAVISGFSLVSDLDWLTSNKITFNTNSITIDAGSGSADSGTATLTLTTRLLTVPEPTSALLVGVALLGAATVRRRQAAAQG